MSVLVNIKNGLQMLLSDVLFSMAQKVRLDFFPLGYMKQKVNGGLPSSTSEVKHLLVTLSLRYTMTCFSASLLICVLPYQSALVELKEAYLKNSCAVGRK